MWRVCVCVCVCVCVVVSQLGKGSSGCEVFECYNRVSEAQATRHPVIIALRGRKQRSLSESEWEAVVSLLRMSGTSGVQRHG
jgi:hypothetical protein